VDLFKWMPRMQEILEEFIQVLELPNPPEVFIARQKCNLCHWYSQCYAIAQSEKHLSLVPGVTPIRYTQLQALAITTLESLANTNPSTLENLL
ncbi:MAG: TM0106 family RecB-like putative nuclease, partial [Nostoc sp.]